MSEQRSLTLWRLVKAQYAESAFDGEGAFRFGGRWNSRGRRVVYASSTLSLAILEILVHLDPSARLPELVALSINVPLADIHDLDASKEQTAAPMQFPWQLRETREWGDHWQKNATSPALRAPSTIVPIESNFLINPTHPKFSQYTISEALPCPIDNRFLQSQ